VLPPGNMSATWKDQNIAMHTLKKSLRDKTKIIKLWLIMSINYGH